MAGWTGTARSLEARGELVAAASRARTAERRRALVLPGLALLLLVVMLSSAAVGGVALSVREIVGILLREVGADLSIPITEQQEAVFLAIRLPRVLLGVLVGAGLGISGASMQGVFRNPLVDPGLLGVSGGAALGAVGTIVLGAKLAHGLPPALAPYLLPLAAFVGALAATLFVRRLAKVDGRTAVSHLLLAGIAMTSLTQAFTGLLIFTADDAQLRSVTFWSMGSLGGATWRTLLAASPFVALPAALLVAFGRPLNALLLGEAEAGHLGFSAEKTKTRVTILVALVVGASVAVAGVLGFVGLIVPHLLRLVVGPDHRVLLPGSALLGAVLLLLADALARTLVVPAELPLGIVTACIGAPFFLGLLLRERRRFA